MSKITEIETTQTVAFKQVIEIIKTNRILEIRTTQTRAFKQFIELISDVVSNCCIVFIQPDRYTIPNTVNFYGIQFSGMTEDKSLLINLSLDASNFESFMCEESKIKIGIDIHNLNTLLKMVNDDSPIVLYMNRDNRSSLYIRSLNMKDENTDIEIFLMTDTDYVTPFRPIKFKNSIMISSNKFKTFCKQLNKNYAYVKITSSEVDFLFEGQNECDINIHKKENNTDIKQIIQTYNLRYLIPISKCNKLSDTIEIYHKDDFPIALVISVPTLGKLYVYLTPMDC